MVPLATPQPSALACGDLLRPRILFVYELDLLIDYLAGKPVDRSGPSCAAPFRDEIRAWLGNTDPPIDARFHSVNFRLNQGGR
jgi:hypothetical protein